MKNNLIIKKIGKKDAEDPVNERSKKTEKKRVTIYMDKNVMENLKIEAVKKETTVSALVEKMAEEMLGRKQ